MTNIEEQLSLCPPEGWNETVESIRMEILRIESVASGPGVVNRLIADGLTKHKSRLQAVIDCIIAQGLTDA